MPQQVQGIIARSKNAPVEKVTINVPDPGPGEAVVQVQACGVCHTDLHYVQGGIGDDYPYLLGHEAAGIVESVGEGVRDLGPGDSVAVIGCGGVGAAAIAGARLAGAAKIIAIDISDRKLALARELGATDVVNSKEADPVQAVQDLTGGFGAAGGVFRAGGPPGLKKTG